MGRSGAVAGARSPARVSCMRNDTPRPGSATRGPAGPTLRPMLRTVIATRYVTPLREGGSVPALVEADDDGLYVVKLLGRRPRPQGAGGGAARRRDRAPPRAAGARPRPRGARRGAGEGRARPGDPGAARSARPGRTSGSTSCPARSRSRRPSARARTRSWRQTSSGSTRFTTNVDRTPRNPNLLVWHRRLHLIDHGSALYIHHTLARTRTSTPGGRSSRSATTCCCRSRAPSRRRPTSGWRRGSTGRCWRRWRRRSPTTGCRPRTGLPDPDAHRRAYVDYLVDAARGAARVRRGGRACPSRLSAAPSRRRQPLRVRDRAGRAPRRARRGVQRRDRAHVAGRPVPRRARRRSTRRCWRRCRPTATRRSIRDHLATIGGIADGDPAAGPIAALSAPERFHWLVSPSSTIIQAVGRPHRPDGRSGGDARAPVPDARPSLTCTGSRAAVRGAAAGAGAPPPGRGPRPPPRPRPSARPRRPSTRSPGRALRPRGARRFGGRPAQRGS